MKIKTIFAHDFQGMSEEIKKATEGLDVISVQTTYVPSSPLNEEGIVYTILYKEKDSMENSRKLEMLAGIIETFENFLEYKGIDIENPEREENGSLIYGEDYYSLEEEIENILRCYGLLSVNFHSKCNTPVALTMTECCSNYDKRKE